MRFSVSGRFKVWPHQGARPRAEVEAFVRRLGADFGPVSAETTHTLVGANPGRTHGVELDAIGLRALLAPSVHGLIALFDSPADQEVFREIINFLDEFPMPTSMEQANLTGRVLHNMEWPDTNFEDVDLTGGGLPNCQVGLCHGGTFIDAHLEGVRLAGGEGADFRNADLREALLVGSYRGADFRGANLAGAHFNGDGSDTFLVGAQWRGANLVRTDFAARVAEISFAGWDLTKTRFSDGARRVNFEGAALHLPSAVDLLDCNLRGVRFHDSSLVTADLRGSDLTGADLTDVNMAWARTGPPKGSGRSGPATQAALEMMAGTAHWTTMAVTSDGARLELLLSPSDAGSPPTLQWTLRGGERSGRMTDLDEAARWLSEGDAELENLGFPVPARPRGRLGGTPRQAKAACLAAWTELLGEDPVVHASRRSRKAAEVTAHHGSLVAMGEAEHHDRIAADIDDLDSWKVYADWLIEQNDPRGELILREHAAESERKREQIIRDFLAQEPGALMGDLYGQQDARYGYRNAFISTIHVRADPNSARLCRTLATHPATRFAREVSSDTVASKVVGPLFELVTAREIRSFSLAYTRFSDSEHLGALSGLDTLNLNGTPLADLSPLAALSGLRHLALRQTKVQDLTPLSGLSGLETVDLGRLREVDVAVLTPLSALKRLSLHHTELIHPELLLELPALSWLEIHDGQLSDALIAELEARSVEVETSL